MVVRGSEVVMVSVPVALMPELRKVQGVRDSLHPS